MAAVCLTRLCCRPTTCCTKLQLQLQESESTAGTRNKWHNKLSGLEILTLAPYFWVSFNFILTLVNVGYFQEEITQGGAQSSFPPIIPFDK